MLIAEVSGLLTLLGLYIAVQTCLANHPGDELEQAAQLPFAEEPDRFDA
ncbi:MULTISPECIES: hypothetical protein [Pseudomonadaceae]|nr:hypothetical protein [Halopseudomonas gallaeciensis]|tara:strand:+ start:1828 stop:1974 length:147 start_codon:yes stop_codon:yes gene_type:complete